jgi:hypothetical protein
VPIAIAEATALPHNVTHTIRSKRKAIDRELGIWTSG